MECRSSILIKSYACCLSNVFWAAVIFPLAEQISYILKCKGIRKRLENASYFGKRRLNINETGMTISSSAETTEFKWNDFIRVSEDSSHYFLYVMDNKAFPIPKYSDRLSKEQNNDYNALIHRYINTFMVQKPQTRKHLLSSKVKVILRIILLLVYIFLMLVFDYQKPQNVLTEDAFDNTTSMNYSGESEHWEIINYKAIATPKYFNTEEGTIYMKGKSEYLADLFKVKSYVVFNEEIFNGHKLYEFELTPKKPALFTAESGLIPEGELDISQQSTSHTIQMPVIKKSGAPVTINDIQEVYFIIEWKGKEDTKINREKVILTPTSKNN